MRPRKCPGAVGPTLGARETNRNKCEIGYRWPQSQRIAFWGNLHFRTGEVRSIADILGRFPQGIIGGSQRAKL
jgi:hypothetical protein